MVDYVREEPLRSLAVATAAGFILAEGLTAVSVWRYSPSRVGSPFVEL
jgi:hypothetical protein